MAELLIGIDVGTSVIKCVAFDLTGVEAALAAKETVIHRPAPGFAEQDMNEVWEAAVETLKDVAAQVRDRGDRVAAIGITAQGDGSWFIGFDGQPVGRAILWLDGRVSHLVEQWHADGTADEVFRETGTAVCNSIQNGQLRWVQDHEPERFRLTRAVVHAKDWVFFRLTGELSTDESDVAHTFYNLQSKTMSERVLEALGIQGWRDKIPPVRPAYRNTARLDADVAREVGLPAGTPVACGPFDIGATALGVGAIRPGQAYSVVGTAGIHGMAQDRPETTPFNVGHTILLASPNHWLRVFGSMAGTLNLDWFLDTFLAPEQASMGAGVYDWIEKTIAQVPAGSDGLIYLPYIDPAGERAPVVLPWGRADFFGIDATKRREHFLRAVYEGVAYSARDCYGHFPMEPTEIRMAGGGSRSREWMRIWAAVAGKPLVFCHGRELGALGAAINAAVAVGMHADYEAAVAQMVRVRDRMEPEPELTEVYARLFPVYEELRKTLPPVWEKRRLALGQPDGRQQA